MVLSILSSFLAFVSFCSRHALRRPASGFSLCFVLWTIALYTTPALCQLSSHEITAKPTHTTFSRQARATPNGLEARDHGGDHITCSGPLPWWEDPYGSRSDRRLRDVRFSDLTNMCAYHGNPEANARMRCKASRPSFVQWAPWLTIGRIEIRPFPTLLYCILKCKCIEPEEELKFHSRKGFVTLPQEVLGTEYIINTASSGLIVTHTGVAGLMVQTLVSQTSKKWFARLGPIATPPPQPRRVMPAPVPRRKAGFEPEPVACGGECSNPRKCPFQCLCKAQHVGNLILGVTNVFFGASCVSRSRSSSLMGKRSAQDMEIMACPCNATYVSIACCGSRDGLIWEDLSAKLGEL